MKSNYTKRPDSFPEKLIHGDPPTTLRNRTTVANHLNKTFVEKGPKLANDLPQSETPIYKTMGRRNPVSMSFEPISSDEVVSIVNELKIKNQLELIIFLLC